jgi:acyl-CoA thioesterase FadM
MTAIEEIPGVLLPRLPDTPGKYAIDHIVTFGETSRAGVVYYSRLIEWQGICRERFGFHLCPEYMKSQELTLLTMSVTCEYLAETFEADHISIRLTIPWVRLHVMKGEFEYYRITDHEQLIARGTQVWASTRRTGTCEVPQFEPSPWPEKILDLAASMGADLTRATKN